MIWQSPRQDRILSPFTLGPLQLRNRIVMLPMETLFSSTGAPNARDVAFYTERQGLGLVITGGTIVHPTSLVPGRRMVRAYDPANIPAFARLAAAIHSTGAHVVGQLTHRGRDLLAGDSHLPSWGPSAVPSLRQPLVPHEMTTADIQELIESFAISSAHLKAAGFSGIELQSAHGYLLAQFLNPQTNNRDDDYGGSLPGRHRLLLDVAAAVRNTVGPNLVVGVRLSMIEEVDGGLTLPDTQAVVDALEDSGSVDYISLTAGVRGSYVRDMTFPEAVLAPLAAEIKQRTQLAVILAQRITTPERGEAVLASGAADLVGLARGLIADPDWAVKAALGQSEEIRPCVACLQDCRARGDGVGCIHNPAAGREGEWGRRSLVRSQSARRVIVVGAGAAGLEAALVAARRGHQVLVLERSHLPGGQVRVAAAGPGRGPLGGVIDYRLAALKRLGVEVHDGDVATAATVLGWSPDAVVVATGAVPLETETGNLTAWALLAGNRCGVRAGRQALVLDDGLSGWPTCSAAELLLELGMLVAVVTPAPFVGAGLPQESQEPMLRRLLTAGSMLTPFSRVVEFGQGEVVIETIPTGDRSYVPADLVVVNAGRRAEDSGRLLADELTAAGVQVLIAGDCLAPRGISEAVREGHAAGRAV